MTTKLSGISVINLVSGSLSGSISLTAGPPIIDLPLGSIALDVVSGSLYVSGSSGWEQAGSGGGASKLSDLTDVDLTNLQDSNIILYDSGSDKWVATVFPSGSISGEGLISYRALVGF
jgi:hypothetical protein